MKMFFITAAALVFCSLAGTIRCESLVETAPVHLNQSCAPWETSCALGCCPFKDGVCCVDGFECCEHLKTCIPFIGICVGAVNNNGEISLTSNKSTPLRASVLSGDCPTGMVECAPEKCCIYPKGVCCSDGEHCCKQHYTCDVPNKRCIPDSTNAVFREVFTRGTFGKPLSKLTRKPPYKPCPGLNRICPSYMSCCIDDNGEWGCCPNAHLREIRYGGGECCDTIFGHMCCPDDYPHCTIFGCTK